MEAIVDFIFDTNTQLEFSNSAFEEGSKAAVNADWLSLALKAKDLSLTSCGISAINWLPVKKMILWWRVLGGICGHLRFLGILYYERV